MPVVWFDLLHGSHDRPPTREEASKRVHRSGDSRSPVRTTDAPSLERVKQPSSGPAPECSLVDLDQ